MSVAHLDLRRRPPVEAGHRLVSGSASTCRMARTEILIDRFIGALIAYQHASCTWSARRDGCSRYAKETDTAPCLLRLDVALTSHKINMLRDLYRLYFGPRNQITTVRSRLAARSAESFGAMLDSVRVGIERNGHFA